MKKGQVLQGTVAYVDFPNKGVVKVEEGKQVIVKNVLPGQEISFSVNKVRKGKGEGRLQKECGFDRICLGRTDKERRNGKGSAKGDTARSF